MTMGVVAALLRLRVPEDVDRSRLEALVLRAISTAVPAGPELIADTSSATAYPWPYTLVLRAATLRAPMSADYLVAAAARAADQAVRREYGNASGATAVRARTAEELAACRRAAAAPPASSRSGRR